MVSRLRTRKAASPVGGNKITTTLGGTTIGDQPSSNFFSFEGDCSDTVGQFQVDNPLSIVKIEKSYVPLSGERVYASTRIKWGNYFPSGLVTDAATHLPTSSPPNNANLATTVLSRSNPSRAHISTFNFGYELKDLPGMIRDIGRLKLLGKRRQNLPDYVKQSSNFYLSYVMGWAPLISDLRKLIDFTGQVDRRIDELNRLYKNGGIKRTFKKVPGRKNSKNLFEDTRESTTSATIDFFGVNAITVKRTKTTTVTVWATVRWIPTAVPDWVYSSKKMRSKAYGLVFGLNLSPKYIWDAIPWSWLVDWFTNTGDFLGSYSNAVPAKSMPVNIMTSTVTTSSSTRSDRYSDIYGGEGTATRSTKSRVQAGASLSGNFPFLSGKQLSILGALHVQRLKR